MRQVNHPPTRVKRYLLQHRSSDHAATPVGVVPVQQTPLFASKNLPPRPISSRISATQMTIPRPIREIWCLRGRFALASLLVLCACTKSQPGVSKSDLESVHDSADARTSDCGPQDSDTERQSVLESWLQSLPPESSDEAAACVDDQQTGGSPSEVPEEGIGCGCDVASTSPCGDDFVCVFNGWSVVGCDQEYLCRIPCEASDDCPDNWGCLALGEDIVVEPDTYKHCVSFSPLSPLVCQVESTSSGVHVKVVDEQLVQFVALRIDGYVVDAMEGDCWSWEMHEKIVLDGEWPAETAQFKVEWTVPWVDLQERVGPGQSCGAVTVVDCEGNWHTCRGLLTTVR